MSRWWSLIYLYFFLVVNALAEPCTVAMTDLSAALQSDSRGQVLGVSGLSDPYSNEPVSRYVQLLPDGAMLVVEQKNCLMYNLTVTLLLPEGVALDGVPEVLATTLAKTDVWEKWFGKLDAAQILRSEFASPRLSSQLNQPGSVSYPLDDKISAASEQQRNAVKCNPSGKRSAAF